MTDEPQNVSRGAWWAIGATVIALLIVVIYSNVQHARREQVEKVTVTHYTPSPPPKTSVSPAP